VCESAGPESNRSLKTQAGNSSTLDGFFTCGLERSAKEQLGSEDAQRTCWRAVSGSFQQVLTVGSPLTPGSCTPGSQRRGTGLLQSDIIVFGNVIVIVFVFLADGKRCTVSG